MPKQYRIKYSSGGCVNAYNCILCHKPIVKGTTPDSKWCRIAHIQCSHYKYYPTKNGVRHK